MTTPEVRKMRAQVLNDFDLARRLSSARYDVEDARAALNRVRDVSAEQAALDKALLRLAELEAEDALHKSHQDAIMITQVASAVDPRSVAD